MDVKRFLSAILICWTFTGSFAWGGVYDTNENSSPQKVLDGMAGKAGRGITNVATGWLEFPKQIKLTYNEEGPTKGCLIGPFKGLGMAVARTLAGVGEFATFFSAYPGFYEPYFAPAFVWEKE